MLRRLTSFLTAPAAIMIRGLKLSQMQMRTVSTLLSSRRQDTVGRSKIGERFHIAAHCVPRSGRHQPDHSFA